ncbi:alpha/beta hydrolase fold domain-containing protein [Arthrobacter sp. NPDC058192]|uniref:alpha/beta hydrolase fold domain-containing protein n=1 Tax=Arthrobacter sp. NPDC058192 TaxID=3346372 RepID=UPI0036EA7743
MMTNGCVVRGIEFARTGDDGSRPLLLDLYLPEPALPGLDLMGTDPAPAHGQAPRPAVVHFHGGGWRMGERSSLGPVLDGLGFSAFDRLLDTGFVVASADYRLSHEAQYPAQLHDAKAAVRWLRNHAADYNVDPDRIYAWGDSAGGHLASLVGLTGISAEDSSVAAVAAWYPPTDLGRMAEQSPPDAVVRADDPGSREELLIGAVLADEPEKAAAASPVRYVSASAPPFFLAHGTADRFVPAAQSASLAAALESAGADVELLLVDDADHMWTLPDQSLAAAERAMGATVSFFLRRSRTPDAPTP